MGKRILFDALPNIVKVLLRYPLMLLLCYCATPLSLLFADSVLVTQQFRYRTVEAGEVFIVWGINGWTAVPSAILPAGTLVKNGLVHTPMVRQGETFIAEIQVPTGTEVDYGFLITKRQDGAIINSVWDSQPSYHRRVDTDNSVDIHATGTLVRAKEFTKAFAVGIYLLVGVCIVVGIGIIFTRIPPRHNRQIVILVLIGLTLLGLFLRLWVAGTTQRFLDTPVQLIGDEARYEDLACALLQGEFFLWPGSTPIYPLFLASIYVIFGHSFMAVLYGQAVIGAASVLLTYCLARRFTGSRSSLVAAELIALHPSLISQVGYLYTEVLYMFLFLLTLLSLLWALEAPLLRRFVLAGATLAVSTLCRPATALMPLVLPLILPHLWNVKRRIVLCIAFFSAMTAIIAPWTYHNYRTYNTFLPFSLSLTMLWHGSPEFYHLMKQKPNAMLRVWDEELNPARNGGHNPLTIAGDRYFKARAIASIQAEPSVYAWYSLQKLAFFWLGHPAAHYDWPFNFDLLPSFSAKDIASFFGARLLFLAAALTALLILRRSLRVFIPLLSICGYFMCIYAILVPVARYSEPLYPILAVIIATAASQIMPRHQSQPTARTAQTSAMTMPCADAVAKSAY
jgi:4-amino-4-deoxy-L-arabinose transferase-like glycosyltransferase